MKTKIIKIGSSTKDAIEKTISKYFDGYTPVQFKKMMVSMSEPANAEFKCYTKKIGGTEFNYSNNCISHFGINFWDRGIYTGERFNINDDGSLTKTILAYN